MSLTAVSLNQHSFLKAVTVVWSEINAVPSETKTAISGVDSPSGNLTPKPSMEKSWCWHMALKPQISLPLLSWKHKNLAHELLSPESQNHEFFESVAADCSWEKYTHRISTFTGYDGVSKRFYPIYQLPHVSWNVKTNSKAEAWTEE